jgi:hypothetical protein
MLCYFFLVSFLLSLRSSAAVVPSARAKSSLPVYWINMDNMADRRDSMIRHLDEYGVQYQKRIPALTPETCNLLMVDSNCYRVSLVDIAIACSHVYALHTALNDESSIARSSKYFLLLEDDVRFKFNVDFDKLVAAAPNDFGSLQLMMSHKMQIEESWNHYVSTISHESTGNGKESTKAPDYFVHRPRNSTVWSAQAVLYNKEVIRPIINRIVARDRQGKLGYKLVTSGEYDKNTLGKVNSYKPTISCSCLFADMFVYALSQPSYISAIPAFNSAVQGINSTYHQSHVVYHLQGFARIQQIQESMLQNATFMPSFISPLTAEQQGTAADKSASASLRGNKNSDGSGSSVVDWVDVAKKNPATGHGVPQRFNFE